MPAYLRPITAVVGRVLAVMAALVAPAAFAQVLGGTWVDAGQQRIEALRMGNLRVIVLNSAGETVGGAAVRVTMQRHAFAFGFLLSPEPFAIGAELPGAGAGETPPQLRSGGLGGPDLTKPVWRCFSAVSLELISAFPVWGSSPDRMLAWCNAADLTTVRYGPVLGLADGQPPWFKDESADIAHPRLTRYLHSTIRTHRGRVQSFDLPNPGKDDAAFDTRYGDGALRQLYMEADALAPHTRMAVRFNEALLGPKLQDAVRQATALREQFAPFDELAISATLDGTLVHTQLERALGWLETLDRPIVIAALQVKGPTPSAAAINLETVLRVLWAHPKVSGIYLANVQGAGVEALLDEQGDPTPAGAVFDRLVHGLWWTDTTLRTDGLGNARGRVYAGWYELSVTLPDGSTATAPAYVAAGPERDVPRVVVLQPLQPVKPGADATEAENP